MSEENSREIETGIQTAPYQKAYSYYEVEKLVEWAIKYGYMLKIIYAKPNESSYRLILPIEIDGHLVRAELITTIREGIHALEISQKEDSFRSFAISRIVEAEPFVFKENSEI